MDGLQLLKCINKDYDIPVILTTDDVMHELIGDGLNNGAESCLLKPILPDAVRDIWQFYELRKVNKNIHTMSGSSLAKVPSSIGPSTTDNSNDKPAKWAKKIDWTPRLHNRFVDAILVTGYHKAIPNTILEKMNEPGVSREQVASHLQKYRKFLNGVLDGKISLQSSKYCSNLNYNHSSIVDGNPNLFLINQLRNEQRSSKDAAPIRASLPMLRFNEAGSSSRLIMNAMSAPNYAPCADINIKADWLSNGIATSENDGNLNIGNIVESNHAYYNRYEEGEKGDYNQTTLTPHQNNKFSDGGLLGGANINDWLHATNLTVLSDSVIESIHNAFISQPPLNPEAQGNTRIFNRNNFNRVQENSQPAPSIDFSFGENQFIHPLGMDDQLGAMQSDINTSDGSLGIKKIGNTLTINEETRYMQPTHSGIGASLVANQDEYTFPVNKKPRNGDDDCNELNNFDLLSFDPDSSKKNKRDNTM
ncbi:two-component response regulator ORR24 [Daucus carota subsp. sativus]|uniref:two-component response regulator ORR24 n=1 Tax=Daucus carota subsp. sativus TaxID=79200 RepID=UPI0007EFBC2D|nr:PREDICTED: two-component response regulator ORR24-like [Daucus carota subsp. sativus]